MMIITQKKHIYFENLNTIRFIAASSVIIHHIEQFKNIFNTPNYWGNPSVRIIGGLGVVLFFVLSGFLISYLLFKENEVTHTISVKDFYIRRVLRIWPLYFLIILVSFFVFPFIDFFSIPGFTKDIVWHNMTYKLILFVVFLPNLVLIIFGIIPFASQTWSIGAEEQFYLIWPILNKNIKNKWLLMFSVILFYLSTKLGLSYFPNTFPCNVFQKFWSSIPIDCMAIGGVFALIAYKRTPIVNKLKKIIFNKIVQWSTLITLFFLIFKGFNVERFHPTLGMLHYEFYAIFFGILIINFACNENRVFSMENRIFNYLGKISYGLYMYHSITIVLSLKICTYINNLSNSILYPLVLTLTIILSAVSFEFFEKIFINKKIKYSKVLSRK